MFDYPIPLLRGGQYAQLGLGPDASAEEINEAGRELAARLKSRKSVLQRELDAVYEAVPQLRETGEKLQRLQQAGADADPAEYRSTQVLLANLEEQARSLRSDFKTLRDESVDVERQLNEVNLLAIQNPKDRLEYDRSQPPFELIKLADCVSNPLDDRKTMLALVRAELSEFLIQSGEDVFHPSDFTREDFSHDFTLDPTLDRTTS